MLQPITRLPSTKSSRTLLLTLDAFDTIFHPRLPVADQYAQTAHSFGLPPSLITAHSLQQSFKPAFKAQSVKYLNYGREQVLEGRYGGPREWWGDVIRGSFARAMNSDSNPASVELPDGLVERLLDRFAGKEGYAVFDDAMQFFTQLRRVKGGGLGIFDKVVVGVISNSDDRVPAVLRDLGLRVGETRADQGVSSFRLPGFEERSSPSPVRGEMNDLDFVITSYEAGEEKPSRVIFDVAERQARMLVRERSGSKEDTSNWVRLHVGDEYTKDYEAAINAGWDGCYLVRDVNQDLEGVQAIQSMTELFTVLEKYR